MVARNPPAASLPCCFSAFPFVSLFRRPACRISSLSLSRFAFLVSSPLPFAARGGWFIGFIGAPARVLRILFSNYTVTCNRPCQLAAPFFRSSSARFFFFLSPLRLEIRRGVQPLRRDRRAREGREGRGSRARGSGARDRTRQLILRILRARVTSPPLEQGYSNIQRISFKARLICHTNVQYSKCLTYNLIRIEANMTHEIQEKYLTQ